MVASLDQLTVRYHYHSSFSVGVLAEQTSLSAEAPRKYPRSGCRKAHLPAADSGTKISKRAPLSFSSASQVTLPNCRERESSQNNIRKPVEQVTAGWGKRMEDNHLVDGEVLVQMGSQADGVGVVAEGFQSPKLLLLQR